MKNQPNQPNQASQPNRASPVQAQRGASVGSSSSVGMRPVGSDSGRATGSAQLVVGPSSTTTKKEIIDRIAANTRQKRSTVKRTVQAFLDTVIDELSVGNRLELRDFGVFEIRERAARTAQNPKTLERVAVPARKTVKFKVGRLMKESVEEPERPSGTKSGKGARG